jgi:hypothetical protein
MTIRFHAHKAGNAGAALGYLFAGVHTIVLWWNGSAPELPLAVCIVGACLLACGYFLREAFPVLKDAMQKAAAE